MKTFKNAGGVKPPLGTDDLPHVEGAPEDGDEEAGGEDGDEAAAPKKSKASTAGGLSTKKAKSFSGEKGVSSKDGAARALVNKKFGAGKIMTASSAQALVVQFVRTGVLALDAAFGGGVPRGRFSRFVGWESSGKSLDAYLAIAAFQRSCRRCGKEINRACRCKKPKPMKAILFDIEGAYTLKRGHDLGIDNARLDVIQPEFAEEGIDISRVLLSSGEYDLLVLDSIAALTPSVEVETSIGKANMAPHARLMNRAIRIWQSAINKSGLADDCKPHVMMINQWREKTGLVFGDKKTLPGGNGQKYVSSLDVDFQRARYTWLDADAKVIPKAKKLKTDKASFVDISFETFKNRCYIPKIGGSFRCFFRDVEYSTGEKHTAGEIDEREQLFELGINAGVITQEKRVYRYKDVSARVEDDFKLELLQKPETTRSLKDDLLGVLLS